MRFAGNLPCILLICRKALAALKGKVSIDKPKEKARRRSRWLGQDVGICTPAISAAQRLARAWVWVSFTQR